MSVAFKWNNDKPKDKRKDIKISYYVKLEFKLYKEVSRKHAIRIAQRTGGSFKNYYDLTLFFRLRRSLTKISTRSLLLFLCQKSSKELRPWKK